MKIAPKQYARALVAALHESKDVQVVAANFAERLRRDGRLRDANRILTIATRLWNDAHGESDVGVATARPLTKKMQKEMTSSIEQSLGLQKAHAVFTDDPTLIGGVVISYGDTRIDGSVRRQLATLEHALTNT